MEYNLIRFVVVDEYTRIVGLYVRDQLNDEQTRARPEYCRRL
jgi:hypothetical protein